MSKLLDLVKEKSIVISDGAWGTLLHEKGLPPGECPESWNVSHPDIVRQIPEGYIAAGSEVVLTNSFGASPLKLGLFNLSESAHDFNFAAAKISRAAAGDEVLVLASVGPTGQFLAPLGEISEKEMIENFRTQIKGLADGGADAILIETMSDIGEASCAVRAAQDVCDLPILVSMTLERGKQGYRTLMGNSVAEIVTFFTAAGVDILGTNCGNGTAGIVEIVQEFRSFTDKPIVAHPNAGLPVVQDGETIFPERPDEMASLVPDLVEAGANIIGGCCGTGPDHIRAIAQQVRAIRAQKF
ncbi:MAG: methionine synthase [Calditrichaeota bacterium]|nr:methionine synthase [Calditrichota bacterium]